MSPSCAAYEALPSFQLAASAGITGNVDCTAHTGTIVIASSTCGHRRPTGRTIRLQSSEPVPDKDSPGLNLPQVEAVALRYGVNLDVRIGTNSVPWDEYERRRKAGQPTILQVRYGPIADSRYDAGRGFRANHALAETVHASYDPLADGRASGVFRHDGSVYSRAVIWQAATKLWVNDKGDTPRPGTVWAAFGPDVVPSLWGSVSAAVRAVDPEGRKVAAAIRKTGHDYGSVIDTADLAAALKRAKHDYGTMVDPADVRWLLTWAGKH